MAINHKKQTLTDDDKKDTCPNCTECLWSFHAGSKSYVRNGHFCPPSLGQEGFFARKKKE